MEWLTTATSHDERDRGADVAVLPIGSFEQHGGHLPLMTDTLIACVIAKALSDAHDLFLLPPLTLSCSHEHASFAGTVSLSAATVMTIVDDVAASLRQQGVEHLVLVNAHGGNYALSNVVQQANVECPRMALYPSPTDWRVAREVTGCETDNHTDMHGGEAETSILMHYAPHLVGDGWRDADWAADERPDLLVQGMAGYTTTGIIGRPSAASAAKGEALVGSLVEQFQSRLDALRGAARPGSVDARVL